MIAVYVAGRGQVMDAASMIVEAGVAVVVATAGAVVVEAAGAGTMRDPVKAVVVVMRSIQYWCVSYPRP